MDMDFGEEETRQGGRRVVPLVGRVSADLTIISPPPASSFREREARRGAHRRGALRPQGCALSSTGCRHLPQPRRPPALPRPRVSPAFFGPLRIHAMGHSASVPRRSRRASIAGRVLGSGSLRFARPFGNFFHGQVSKRSCVAPCRKRAGEAAARDGSGSLGGTGPSPFAPGRTFGEMDGEQGFAVTRRPLPGVGRPHQVISPIVVEPEEEETGERRPERRRWPLGLDQSP